MSFLSSIGTALPKYKYTQTQLLAYMQAKYRFEPKEAQKLALMYGRSGIEHRYSTLSDFGLNQESDNFFEDQKEVSVSKRMEMFFKHAPELAASAALQAMQAEPITHLITVSCTGMAAPGLDIMLIKALQLSPETPRTSVNFMGCYAVFHALKMADAICNSTPHARVLLVSVELCTLHFNQTQTTDLIAANLLFGDGASACIISSDQPKIPYLKLSSFYSLIIPKGNADMAWHIHEEGFLMTLSAYIPQLIEEGIGPILESALAKQGVKKESIQHWAFHPGGRKIVDNIAKALDNNANLSASYEVLREVGNLSSATLLFVLKKIVERENYRSDQPVFSAGFGPGLTVETCLFNV
jgi:predicted naringenin-chalcone synthase